MQGSSRGLQRRLESLARSQREQERADLFWRLWDLRWGARKELLLLGLGVAVPAYIFGSDEPFMSLDNVWALAGGLVALWSLLGLLPAYTLRQELTLHPALVQAFMAQQSSFESAKDFAKRLYIFLSKAFKTADKRSGLRVLVGMERIFEFMARNFWWAFPLLLVLALGVAILSLAAFEARFGAGPP